MEQEIAEAEAAIEAARQQHLKLQQDIFTGKEQGARSEAQKRQKL